jgi:hypothetical protein
MRIEELRTIANGYFAGENVSDEIKEAWIKGVLFGIRNYSAFTSL